ncbi:uncharacterized protein BYT42DRAFT_632278 [Radiomyces spectabilis]|uniref:uncharacterized protein n=1 Tax=Radiomyces spectabilis TaxID=64574 RepID=UPI00221F2079|nr:uncharacterized protein BYT42DRAFT_632278 [Radiomyces spectabilis]KAI8388929.1 hypothetical protein BYT42DRAFT_632278 [Radiomyces spectabilis]
MFSLPLSDRPGSDLISKLILQDQRIMNIITKELIGKPYCENLYQLGQTEWSDSSKSDVVYVPLRQYQKSLPPILIEVQHGIDNSFLTRLMKYAISVYEVYGQEPLVFVIGVGRPVPHTIKDLLTEDEERPYLWPLKVGFWKTPFLIATTESLAKQLEKNLLPPLAAIALFFTAQKRCLLGMGKHRHDPNIILLYRIAKEKMQKEIKTEADKRDIISTICKQTENQVSKILDILKKEIIFPDELDDAIR